MKSRKLALPALIGWLIIITVFAVGYWLVVLQPLGPNLTRLPGNLGDTRFNNYILEHNFRWVTGKDPSLLDAPFAYPFPETLTFSDNHFGSMFFYSAFRWLGYSRESAYQGWYLLSYVLSFIAVTYVLNRYKLKPLAIGIGAFFFTFGLPLIVKEGHAQLMYRFCIPLACDAFWQFSQKRGFKQLALMSFWLVWQFYLSIYLGYFLALLLFTLALGIPFVNNNTLSNILWFWPGVIKENWLKSKIKAKIVYSALIAISVIFLFLLFQPYFLASRSYGFIRPWEEVQPMLPRIQSYFLADWSQLWKSNSPIFSSIPVRHEHQLFIGGSASILLIAGLIWRFRSSHKKLAFLLLGAAGFLGLITISIGGFSFYKILFNVPGFSSIRAVTRIILVLMWPLSFFISVVADGILRNSPANFNGSVIILLLLGFMMTESALFNHDTFPKAEAVRRIQALREKIPASIPDEPILFAWNPDNLPWYYTELDAMLLSQDLGWPALNG